MRGEEHTYDDVLVTVRPHLRGRMHLLAAVASVVGLVWLVRSAASTRATVAAWVYGIAAVLLYVTSAIYHVFTRSARARRVMQKADHSMIFVLIAGTITPVCILALGGAWRWVLLAAVWLAAIGGITIKLVAWDRFPRLGNALYIVLGWAGLAALPALVHRPQMLALIVTAGVLYTGGAILFFLGRPRLSPTWFGYHEVWHTFVTAAGVLLFAANLTLVRAG